METESTYGEDLGAHSGLVAFGWWRGAPR